MYNNDDDKEYLYHPVPGETSRQTVERNYRKYVANEMQTPTPWSNQQTPTPWSNQQGSGSGDYTVNTESLVGKPSSYFQNNDASNTLGTNQSLNTTPAIQNQTSAQLPNNNVPQLRMPTGSEQQITMPSYELQQKMQQPSAWDKVKNATNNFAGGTEAFSVGYATGASLGNFDEAMGTATAAVTGNRNNYTMGRNATRQLQTELEQRYPNIYGGAEILGATLSGKYLSPYLSPIVAGFGYAGSRNDILENIGKNVLVSRFTREIQKIPWLSQDWRNFAQNAANWYLLKKEKEEEK